MALLDISEKRVNATHETRERILIAAREVMARKGNRGATTREIADTAGVNEATIFRHFGNKHGLRSAMAQRFCGAVELQALVASLSGDLEGDLFEIGSTMMSRMESLRDMICWSLVEQEDEHEPEPLVQLGDQAWRAPEAIHHVLLDFMARRIEAGDLHGEPGRLTRFFMGIVFAHVMGRKKFPDAEMFGTPEEALRFYIGVFLNGVRNK